MSNLFSYESKPMQLLMFLGDLVLLNLIYLCCCLPIFTIGAAQAGLFTACKVLLDKEDDSSPFAAYWRGFSTGFGTVTLAWGVVTMAVLLVVYGVITSAALGAPQWTLILPLVFVLIFQCLVPAFHARIGCTWWQLIRNTWFLLFAHPLRSIATVAMFWVPAVCFALMKLYDFMALTPIWGSLYFATICCFATVFLRKPFNTLTEHYNEVHGIKPEGNTETLPKETEEAEEEPVE